MWPFDSSQPDASSSQEAGPSTPVAALPDIIAEVPVQPENASNREATPKSRWARTIEDELAYQAKIYPTTEELPGCMSIMYVPPSFIFHSDQSEIAIPASLVIGASCDREL